MNKSDRLKILLEKGYFPEELPPPFNTSVLAKFRASVSQLWDALHVNYPHSAAELYSVPRVRQVRRHLAIVNPVAQFHLAKLIADNWITIRSHLRTSKYTLAVPEIEMDQDRAVPQPDFALVSMRQIEISALFDHALASDISRFYGTLYTHVIPWALHTKTWCKQNLNTPQYRTSLGALLDTAVRKGQENQTLGIPVGPDTSRILSEIVAVAVDEYVQSALSLDTTRAFRNVDDWYIGFDTASEAEDAIATLAMGCRTFELELNAEKTRTLHASSVIDGVWPTELREYRVGTGVRAQARSLEHFFAKSFQYAIDYPNHNVLNFSVKRTRSIRVSEQNWKIYENFLLKAARANMTVIPTVVQILTSYNHNGYSLNKDRIQKLIEDLVRRSAPLGHHAEVARALFLAKALRINISQVSVTRIASLENSVCALLALDLRENNLIEGILDTSLWMLSMTASGLSSHMWLLAYEADLKGWLQGIPPNFVDNDPHFSILKRKGIAFYDIRRNVTHIKRITPKPRSASLLLLLQQFTSQENMPMTSIRID